MYGIQWPNTISNNHLYTRCNSQPLSAIVHECQWSMLGHVLCMPQDTPAQLALQFSVDGSQIYKGRRGRHQTNLVDTITSDLKHHHLALQSAHDIHTLRTLIGHGQGPLEIDEKRLIVTLTTCTPCSYCNSYSYQFNNNNNNI